MRTDYKKHLWVLSNIVASHYSIKTEDLYGRNRHRPYAPARQMVWKIAKDIYGYDLPLDTIGKIFMGRTHATILQGVRSISNQIDTDRSVYNDYKKLLILAKIRIGIYERNEQMTLVKKLKEIIGFSDMVHARVAIREILSTLIN